jgi:DNA-binding transcriptional MerR regulator
MKSRIVTLFGEEELVPEELQAAPKRVTKEEKPSIPVDWENWQPEKQYYAIGEVAKLFAVRTSHIRFWTTEFELKVRTTQKGDRLYTPKNIQELRAIHHLVKERGFTIPGAKTKLKDQTSVSTDTLDLRQSLLKLRNQLSIIRNKLV